MPPSPSPLFAPSPADEPAYAWVVVAACFAAMGLIFGVSYSFAAFFQPFVSEFKAQRADVSLVFGLCGGIYFLFGPIAGMAADRFGPRMVCSAGMACIAAALWLTSAASSMQQVILIFGVGVGLGIALVYTPAIGCVQPWFTRRRGLAAGLASSGIGAGTLVGPLLVAWAIAALQWRNAMQLLAAALLLLGLLATSALRRAPAATAKAGAAVAGHTLGQAMASREFRWLYLMVLLAAPGMFIPFAHVSAAARDIGIDEARAVGLVGLIGIGSLLGRFFIGALADRLGRALTLLLAQASLGLSFLVWAGAGSYLPLVCFTLWMGVSYGGMVSLMPALCMDLFGARAVAGIIGTLYSGAAIGNLAGPWLAGLAFDRLGNYTAVIWGCLLLCAAGTLAVAQVLRHPRAA